MQPAPIPIRGDQSRHAPETRSESPVAITSVTTATIGPENSGALLGTSCTLFSAIGRTVTAISMSTVPETAGVMIRGSRGSHMASAR